jgi:tetratricopeptide (TPR) repeat protein
VVRKYRLVGLYIACSLISTVALAQAGPDYDSLVQKGKTQLQSGRADLALVSASEAIKQNADRWEAYALAGGALMNLKRHEEAADKLSEAIKRAPESKQTTLRDLRRQCLLSETEARPGAPKDAVQPATTQAEIVLWKSIENSSNPADFQSYLNQYPRGAFVVLAERHLAEAKERAAQLPVETPLFQGTLVRQGNLIFLAIARPTFSATPFYMVTLNGEPAFVAYWSWKRKTEGLIFFLQNKIVVRSGSGSREFSASDVVAISPPSRFAQLTKLEPRTKASGFTEIELGLDSDDLRVMKFANLLMQDWDKTLQQFVSTGIDLKKLPDGESFDLKRANSTWDVKRYCCTPR